MLLYLSYVLLKIIRGLPVGQGFRSTKYQVQIMVDFSKELKSKQILKTINVTKGVFRFLLTATLIVGDPIHSSPHKKMFKS